MNAREIDDMMRHLPSQRDRYKAEHRRWIISEALAGLAFTACIVILCLM